METVREKILCSLDTANFKRALQRESRITVTNSFRLMNVDPGFSRQEWMRSRPRRTFLTS